MTSTPVVDLDLIRKYNKPGPRYTSYPTAPHFKSDADFDRIGEILSTNRSASQGLSLYYHIPFCETLCWFCGCTTIITRNRSSADHYIDYLKRDMDLRLPFLDTSLPVLQLHLGGGSPTYLSPDQMRSLGAAVRERFTIAPSAEIAAEIDPRRLTREHIVALREHGFNRASVGVQDNAPNVQKAINRDQPFALTKQAVQWIREEGFRSLNVDLIYGLPGQTAASYAQTLDEILELRPDRFAIFSYAHVPWMKPAQKILESVGLPSPDLKLELLRISIERISGAGYDYIGMDHFALPDDDLAVAQRQRRLQRNFQGYATCAETDIHGFGMSAISQTDDLYLQNIKELPAWRQSLDEGKRPWAKGLVLTPEDKIRRRVIMRVMCDGVFDAAVLSPLTGVDVLRHFARELDGMDDLVADRLIERNASGFTVTPMGRLLIRNIAMRFDAYLVGAEQRFSRTV